MDMYSGLMVLIAVFCIGQQVFGILRTIGKVDIPGRYAGHTGVVVMAVLMAGFALLWWDYVLQEPILFGALAALVVVYLLIRCGLGEKSFYHNGIEVSYAEAEYYMVIREFKRGFTLRLHTRGKKDYILLFKKNQREAVIRRLQEAGVRDWDSFEFNWSKEKTEE